LTLELSNEKYRMYVEDERSAVKREALAEVCLGLLQSLWLKKRKSKKKT